MATPVVKTIKSSGGNYASLNAFESGEQRDLVAADEIAVAECYSFADTAGVIVLGWTVDSTRYIKIYTPTSERHDGKWDSSKYRMEPSGDVESTLKIQERYTLVQGLQVQPAPNNTQYRNAIKISSATSIGDVCIEANVIREYSGSTGQDRDGINSASGNVDAPNYIWNNLIYGFTTNNSTGISTGSDSADKIYVYNNTVADCWDGLRTGFEDTVAKNNLVADIADDAYNGTFETGSDYNSTDNNEDMLGGGANNRKNQTFTFVNAGAGDYHLQSGDTGAKGHGVDLSSDGNLPFNDDIDGDTRSVPWDIGMDQISGVAAALLERVYPRGIERGVERGVA